MPCPTCAALNEPDAKFCEDCGAPMTAGCPRCGAVLTPGKRFCRECGSPVGTGPPAPAATAAAQHVAERRVVSVLFVDLVGFTPLSESRDAEQVRELLSRYFETARTVIARYGGVVEKFIGDAVMAGGGAPGGLGRGTRRARPPGPGPLRSVAALRAGIRA